MLPTGRGDGLDAYDIADAPATVEAPLARRGLDIGSRRVRRELQQLGGVLNVVATDRVSHLIPLRFPYVRRPRGIRHLAVELRSGSRCRRPASLLDGVESETARTKHDPMVVPGGLLEGRFGRVTRPA